MNLSRRGIMGLAGAALATRAAMAQGAPAGGPHPDEELSPEEMQAIQRGGLYVALRDPSRTRLPPEAFAQSFTYSPAPAAAPAGRWRSAAPLPLPRSEMAWAVAWNDRMHVIGGYGAGRVARRFHHVYDPAQDRWISAAPIPRGANHIGVAADDGVVYAFGGFVEQNRVAVPDCYAYVVSEDRWRDLRPLQRGSRGAIAVVAHKGRIHAIGGRDTRSLDWHDAYDPKADAWETRAPIPGPRDHTAAVVIGGSISVVGGRMDTFDFNTGMHVAYDDARDRWEERAPMPTPRSGHGGAAYNGKLFCIGGEGTRRVFGQVEAYDPQSDSWQAHAPMPTPRHGMGAAVVGGAIHVAGGGPMNGGMFQSAVHEAFAL